MQNASLYTDAIVLTMCVRVCGLFIAIKHAALLK